MAVGTKDDAEKDPEGKFFYVLTSDQLFIICVPFVHQVLEHPYTKELEIPDTELAREAKRTEIGFKCRTMTIFRIFISTPLQFNNEDGKLTLLAVLVSLDCLTDKQAGLSLQKVKSDSTRSKITAEEEEKDVLVGCQFTLDDAVVVQVNAVSYRPHGLIGRGNIAIGDVFIVKMGYLRKSREAETSIMQAVVNAANHCTYCTRKHTSFKSDLSNVVFQTFTPTTAKNCAWCEL